MKASELKDIIKGTIISQATDCEIDRILLDSRRITHAEHSVFIPLVTERRDAHQFLPEVYQSGIRIFIVSVDIDSKLYPDAWIIKVANTLQALQNIVAFHRAQYDIPVVGITGSNGKTVVKEWLYQLLETNYKIIRSPKSYNSQIGVPLSVWKMKPEHEMAIFEAGISMAGEMENLEKIIKPTIGIFTNIGESHNEGFMNYRHKINEKLNLFKSCQTLIYNKDYYDLQDAILQFANQLKSNTGKELQLLTWSKKSEAVLQITSTEKHIHDTLIKATYEEKDIQITIPFIDDASIENAIHCWLLLLHLRISNEEIASRMSKLTHIAMRLELIKGMNNCTLINDSYNSDVSSFSIALDLLAQQNQHENKTVILSDIVQSGRDSDLYEEVAELLKQKNIKRFIGIGDALIRNKNTFSANRNLEAIFYKTTLDFLHEVDTTSFANESILIKGARKFEFEKIAKRLEERVHQTMMEVNLNALVNNLKVYHSLLKKSTKVMAMVKAFSYGNGSYEVANKLQFEGIDYLAVAYPDEGIFLRKNRIDLPIMVMNTDDYSYRLLIDWKLEAEVYSLHSLQQMLEAAQLAEVVDYPIHIKLDTGMHRLGFSEEDIEELIDVLSQHKELKVVSVFSHLSGSDEQELDEFTNHQATLFRRMSEKLNKALGYSFLRHLCNSTGIVRHPDLHFDMVRLGLGLYGVDASDKLKDKLKNVSRLKTIISQIKNVPMNETVGYSRKGILKRDTKIGTVCIGYADGISRNLGNGIGKMYVNGHLAPIVGNVCMDMCMLDITDVPDVKEGDVVVVFGEELSVKTLADWANTIPYEILTSISERVKRIYFEE
jgi:alanine racemase